MFAIDTHIKCEQIMSAFDMILYQGEDIAKLFENLATFLSKYICVLRVLISYD